MNTVDVSTRWKNAFIYALVTTVMVLGAASAMQATLGKANQDLANRVDRNAAITRCILQLGIEDPNSPPRNAANVQLCISVPDWNPLLEDRPQVP